MQIHWIPTVSTLLKDNTDNASQTMGITCMAQMGCRYVQTSEFSHENNSVPCLLDWTVSCKLQMFGKTGFELSEDCGLLLHARSKSAMIKGLNKAFDVKGKAPGYLVKTEDGKNISMAWGAYDLRPSATVLGAAIKIMGFNTVQFGKRVAAVFVLKIKELQLKCAMSGEDSDTPFGNLKMGFEKRKFKQKLQSHLKLDFMQSLSSATNASLPFSSGFVVYLAPSSCFLSDPQGAEFRPLISAELDLGQISRQLELSSRLSQSGGIFD